MLKLYEYKFSAMGSPCTLNLYCHSEKQFNEVTALCVKEVGRLENKYSRYKDTSLLSQINNAAGTQKTFTLDDEFFALLNYADLAFKVSDRLFDITSGVLRNIWDFKNKEVPKIERIKSTLKLVGWEKISLTAKGFYLPYKGMQLDLGGIVKEYAADVVSELIRAKYIKHGLVDLGGDIAIVGPHPDHIPWQIAISDPIEPSRAIAKIPMMSGGLASSGDYQRFIMLNGEKYNHILNPVNGWPVKGLAAVSVWAPTCVMAGTIATTAMLKGENNGMNWLDEIECQYLAIDQKMALKKSIVKISH